MLWGLCLVRGEHNKILELYIHREVRVDEIKTNVKIGIRDLSGEGCSEKMTSEQITD